MKYIDADKLIAEIERQQRRLILLSNTEQVDMRRDCALQNGVYNSILATISSLQQEQPELPRIGYAETYYQRGLHDGIVKGQVEILNVLEEIEKRKAEPVLFIKEQEQPEVDLDGKPL